MVVFYRWLGLKTESTGVSVNIDKFLSKWRIYLRYLRGLAAIRKVF